MSSQIRAPMPMAPTMTARENSSPGMIRLGSCGVGLRVRFELTGVSLVATSGRPAARSRYGVIVCEASLQSSRNCNRANGRSGRRVSCRPSRIVSACYCLSPRRRNNDPQQTWESYMSHYSIVSITPSSEDWIPSYLEAVGPLVAKHGGKYLARTASHERLEGDGPNPAIWAIVEWPSKDAEQAFHDDPAYKPHLDSRLAGSESHFFSVAGQDDMAS